jgi:hypothetical protein
VSLCEPDQNVLVRLISFNITPIGTYSLRQLKDSELQLKYGPLFKGNVFSSTEWIHQRISIQQTPRIHRTPTTIRVSALIIAVELSMMRMKNLQDTWEIRYLPILDERRAGWREELRIHGLVFLSRLGVFDKSYQIYSHIHLIESLSGHDDMFIEESWYEQMLEPDSREIKQYSIRLV